MQPSSSQKRKVLIAADHAGFDFKTFLKMSLPKLEFIDLGPNSKDSVDYPDFAKKLCEELLAGKAETGILICGTGQGMAMQANRFKGIRAALCWNNDIAKTAREHNNANVLCLGGKNTTPEVALQITEIFLNTGFEGGRHLRRVEKMG